MKTTIAILTLLTSLAWGQDTTDQSQAVARKKAEQAAKAQMLDAQQWVTFQPKVMNPNPVMGKAIVGAPYSADEITESVQTLGDGTRITHRSQATVYRDGSGRVRRETPSEVVISDPVAHISYRLNPKAMTAIKTNMPNLELNGKALTFYSATSDSSGTAAAMRTEAQVQDLQVMVEKLRKETMPSLNEQLSDIQGKLTAMGAAGNTETLPPQSMEGLTVEGTRTTTTLEAGAIGNDRPIATTNERWYSPDLQTVVMTKRSDPRTGEETFRLTNVRRGEPAADLFLPPLGYQITDRTQQK